jgi:hypothetical protein
MRDPTFVIAGGQRCRTTWLYHLLDAHPDVYMASPVHPEPKFFVADPAPGRDRPWYLRTWFDAATTEHAVGEKSTSYMDAPGVPARMQAAFPGLQIVFVLRHPVERAISNYRLSRTHGLETEPLDTALRTEAERVRTTSFPGLSVHPLAYLQRSRYVEHIERFLAHFDRAALHIIIEDDLDTDPGAACRDLFAFLGVDRNIPPRPPERHANPSPRDNLVLSTPTFEYLVELLAPSTERLGQLLGRDLAAWHRPSPMIAAMIDRHS